MRTAFGVTGDDAETWIQGQVTQNVIGLKIDERRYAFVVDLKGRVMADLWVARDSKDRWTLWLPTSESKLLMQRFESQIIMEDVSIFIDPKAGDILEIYRSESERICRGIPRFGKDFGHDHHPQETGLHRAAVSFNKGCYVGQEVVCMIEARGKPPRRMVHCFSDTALYEGTAITLNSAQVGTLTSVVKSNDGKYVGIACIKRSATETDMTLHAGSATLSIQIIDLDVM